MKSILAINFKAYPAAFDERAVQIAEAAAEAAEKFDGVRVILAVPATIVYRVASVYHDIYLEHVDPVDYGGHTGFIPAKSLEHLPVKGTLLNHSEHKVTLRHLRQALEQVKGTGKEVIACADTPEEAAAIAHFKPTMIAVEPPELIGTGIPVSKAKPEVITRGVEAVHRVDASIPVLAGAGISSPEDAVRALELGAAGVLVASAIMKASDPRARLLEMAEAMNSYSVRE